MNMATPILPTPLMHLSRFINPTLSLVPASRWEEQTIINGHYSPLLAWIRVYSKRFRIRTRQTVWGPSLIVNDLNATAQLMGVWMVTV